jgi:hypothetical protein
VGRRDEQCLIGSYGWCSLYDGATWTKPTPTVSSAWGLTGSGASDLWAVGDDYQIRHWDGSTWSPVTSPVSGQDRWNSIWKIAANDVLIVGGGGQIARYNGQGCALGERHHHGSAQVWAARSAGRR